MSAEFACDDAGRLTALIADYKAEVREYELRVLDARDAELLRVLREEAKYPPALAPLWACRLVRLDTEAAYYVALLGPGRWYCSCADRKYRQRVRPEGCKHLIFSAAFHALCRALGAHHSPTVDAVAPEAPPAPVDFEDAEMPF